jgi:hypothetical protein
MPKKITEFNKYSCMFTARCHNLLHFKKNNPSAAHLDGAMCHPIMINLMERIFTCKANRKGHISDIVFYC